MYSCTLSLTSALDDGGWSTPSLGCFTPGKETQYRRLGGSQGWSGRVRKIWQLPVFDSRTVEIYKTGTNVSVTLTEML